MRQRAGAVGLPLLGKELAEQAARGRTYALRVAYAAALFVVCGVFFYGEVSRHGESLHQLLGTGRRVLQFVILVQLVGIYVFVPATLSGAITCEKEGRTLELLFITDLTPREILLQKLGGRLLPMFTFLLLSLPLMATCYSYGGFSTGEAALGAFVLLTTCVQVGAFSLMVSAYCRTSTGALLATYACGIGLGGAVALVTAYVCLIVGFAAGPLAVVPAGVGLGLFPPFILDAARGEPFMAALTAVAAWGWTAVFLYLARKYLVTRAFLPAKRRSLGFFHALGPVRPSPRRIRGRLRFPDDPTRFPGDEPITWRETTRSALGGPYWLARMSVLFTLPVFFLALLPLTIDRGGRESPLSWLVYLVWVVAALAVSVTSVDCISRERANRTLDVLLASPLAGGEIIRQKSVATRRLIVALMAPFMTLFLLTAAWRGGGLPGAPGARGLGPMGYVATAGLSVPVFLSAFAWLSRWIGLKTASRSRARILALAALLVWNAGPWLAAGTVASIAGGRVAGRWPAFLALLSPASAIGLTERAGGSPVLRELLGTATAMPLVASLVFAGAVTVVFRRLCLRNADRYLGRPSADGRGGCAREAELPAAACREPRGRPGSRTTSGSTGRAG